jgi:Sulfotransferase family
VNQTIAPVFLLGFHRGGTTFVQRLLNCHRDLVVWGEHGGIFYDAAGAYRRFKGSQIQLVDRKDYAAFQDFADRFPAWASPISPDDFLTSLARFYDSIYSLPDQKQRWGIKEIRYGDQKILTFIATLFAEARFVFLMRQPADCFVSELCAPWRKPPQITDLERHAGSYLNKFRLQYQAYKSHSAANPTRCIIVEYEDIVADRYVLQRIFDFLKLDAANIDGGLESRVREARQKGQSDSHIPPISAYLELARRMIVEQYSPLETAARVKTRN